MGIFRDKTGIFLAKRVLKKQSPTVVAIFAKDDKKFWQLTNMAKEIFSQKRSVIAIDPKSTTQEVADALVSAEKKEQKILIIVSFLAKHELLENYKPDYFLILSSEVNESHFSKKVHSNSTIIGNINAIKRLKDLKEVKFISFGSEESCDLKIGEVGKGLEGINFKINYHGSFVPVRIENEISQDELDIIMAVFALALNLSFNLIDVSRVVEKYFKSK